MPGGEDTTEGVGQAGEKGAGTGEEGGERKGRCTQSRNRLHRYFDMKLQS